MKTLNYLQLMRLKEKEPNRYYEHNEVIFNLWKDSGLDEQSFFEQELTPELITKYFEGWEKRNIKNCEYENGVYRVSIDDEQKFIYYSYPRAIQCRKFPRNLDEFITDCQKADIDLELRIV